MHAAGVPAPEAFERVTVEGREGIVLERVSGPTLLESARSDLAARLAEVHAEIHAHTSAALATREERRRANLARLGPAPEGMAEREALVPDGAVVCHALFHPGHVILTARGPVVIDWPDAFSGPAALDVARTAVFLRFLGVTSPAEGRMRQALADGYLREYLARTRVTAEDVARCTPLVAFVLLHSAPEHPERDALERAASMPC